MTPVSRTHALPYCLGGITLGDIDYVRPSTTSHSSSSNACWKPIFASHPGDFVPFVPPEQRQRSVRRQRVRLQCRVFQPIANIADSRSHSFTRRTDRQSQSPLRGLRPQTHRRDVSGQVGAEPPNEFNAAISPARKRWLHVRWYVRGPWSLCHRVGTPALF